MSLPATLALLLHTATAATTGQPGCASVPRSINGEQLDLAPPPGYVEICARDQALCRTLTAAYPASVTTVGYFVPTQEWQAHEKKPVTAFRRYLLAQVASSKTASQLPEVKSFIRSQQTDVPEHAQLSQRLQADGQAALGIFDDTPDSISFGAVSKLPTPPPDAGAVTMVAITNSAIVVGHQLLSLYVYAPASSVADVDQVEELTKHWLRCLREAYRK